MIDEPACAGGFGGGPDAPDASSEQNHPQFRADPAATLARQLRAAAEQRRLEQAERQAKKADERANRSADIQADRLALVRARFNHEVALRLTQWTEALEVRRIAASDEATACKVARIKSVLFPDGGGPSEPGPGVAPSAAYRPEALVPAPPPPPPDPGAQSP
jgi:hypothetical protein